MTGRNGGIFPGEPVQGKGLLRAWTVRTCWNKRCMNMGFVTGTRSTKYRLGSFPVWNAWITNAVMFETRLGSRRHRVWPTSISMEHLFVM